MNKVRVTFDKLVLPNIEIPPSRLAGSFRGRIYFGKARSAGYDADVTIDSGMDGQRIMIKNWSRSLEWDDELKADYQRQGTDFDPQSLRDKPNVHETEAFVVGSPKAPEGFVVGRWLKFNSDGSIQIDALNMREILSRNAIKDIQSEFDEVAIQVMSQATARIR